ncbi:hypothetical protein BGX38DRAFT_1273346 [Terfezia claveryi]|nr:hypothetical protein BGX38DRAFT_1273346 [Terfezia claveryi]
MSRAERRPVPGHQLGGIEAPSSTRASKATPEQLSQWTATELQPGTSSVTKENFTVLGSYNWRDAKRPIIVVPGAPSIWDPPKLPISIKPDRGRTFVDQNGSRYPTSPLEPMLQAVLASNPLFDFNKIDIITDRSNLRQLLQFASGKSHRNFEIAVEVVNKTVLFTRLTKHPKTYIGPGRSQGYGFQFEKAFTKTPTAVGGSTGHHRIVNYTIGGLNVLLRFEVDGALPHNVEPASHAGPQTQTPAVKLSSSNAPQTKGQPFLSQGQGQGLVGASRSVPALSQQAAGRTNLVIVKGGQLIHEQQVLELKTRAYNKDHGLQLQQYMDQLWFANVRHLVLGVHKEGTFSDIKTHTMNDAAVIAWQDAHKEQLGKLIDLLRKITATAKGTTERARVSCVKGNLIMETFHGRQLKLKGLSEDLRRKWATG